LAIDEYHVFSDKCVMSASEASGAEYEAQHRHGWSWWGLLTDDTRKCKISTY